MRLFLLILSAVVGLAFLQGCTTEITGDPHYATGFEKGRVYVTQKDLNGVVDRDPLFRSLINITLLKTPVLPPYKTANEELVILPKGTRILVTMLALTHDIENGTQLAFVTEFASGPHAGKPVVLNQVSKGAKLEGGGIYSWLLVRDPEFIAEETKLEQSPEPAR